MQINKIIYRIYILFLNVCIPKENESNAQLKLHHHLIKQFLRNLKHSILFWIVKAFKFKVTQLLNI